MKSQTRISVKVLPGSARDEIVGLTNGVWRIKIAAPPEKGKANKKLIDFLSRVLERKKDQLEIVGGQASRRKIISVYGMTPEEVAGRLAAGK